VHAAISIDSEGRRPRGTRLRETETPVSTLPRVGEMNAPGRLLLCVFWIAAIVWLAISLSDMHALDQASATRVTATTGQAGIAARIRDAERADRLRPGDTEPLVERGRLLILAGRPGAARTVLEKVVREEPRNVRAWVVLALATFGTDRPRALEAAKQVEALDPRGSAARRR
jgi:hypothetical protein